MAFRLSYPSLCACSYSGGRGASRDVFRSKYLSVLDFVFGNAGLDAGAIQHVPTNQVGVFVHEPFCAVNYTACVEVEEEEGHRRQNERPMFAFDV